MQWILIDRGTSVYSLYGGVTQRTGLSVGDLRFKGPVFTGATHPELVLHQRTAGHDTGRELSITVRAGERSV